MFDFKFWFVYFFGFFLSFYFGAFAMTGDIKECIISKKNLRGYCVFSIFSLVYAVVLYGLFEAK